MPPPRSQHSPRRRKLRSILRRTLKWGGLVITLLLIAVWLDSVRRDVYISRDFNSGAHWRVEISQGVIEFWSHSMGVAGGGSHWRFSEMPARYANYPSPRKQLIEGSQWRPMLQIWSPWMRGGFISLPLWLLTAASLLITAAACRLDHLAFLRSHLNLCATCRYDRTGLDEHAPCPECGVAPG